MKYCVKKKRSEISPNSSLTTKLFRSRRMSERFPKLWVKSQHGKKCGIYSSQRHTGIMTITET